MGWSDTSLRKETKMKKLGWFALGVALFTIGVVKAGVPDHATLVKRLGSNKIRPNVVALFEKEGSGTASVLVTLKARAELSGARERVRREDRIRFVYDSLRTVARESQKDLRALLDSRGIEYRAYYITNMIAIEKATPELVAELAARPEVDRVSGNPKLLRKPLPATPLTGLDNPDDRAPNNIESVGATRVWDELGVRGEKIVVAGQDTGVDWTHPALKGAYRGNQGGEVNHNYNWHDAIQKPIGAANPANCAYGMTEPCDDGGPGGGHGTHTMGTVVGDGGEGNRIGMAPKAQWIACRNMDHGTGRPNTYIECFEFFLAPYPIGGDAQKDGDPTKAPHVINNSWGCDSAELCEGGEFVPVLTALQEAGIMVVVSAGNSGSGCSTINAAPAWNSGYVLSVGAMNHRNGAIAGFSSRGPSARDGIVGPDVTAPGVNVRSSLPGGGYEYLFWSGTSMAGPHVAGLTALLWSARPDLIGKIAETRDLIRHTADPKTTTESCGGVTGETIPNNTFGHGVINAYQAVKTSLIKTRD